jgi:hypothetical protein
MRGPASYHAALDRRALIAAYRVGFCVLTIAAIAAQLLDIAGLGTLDLLDYFTTSRPI